MYFILFAFNNICSSIFNFMLNPHHCISLPTYLYIFSNCCITTSLHCCVLAEHSVLLTFDFMSFPCSLVATPINIMIFAYCLVVWSLNVYIFSQNPVGVSSDIDIFAFHCVSVSLDRMVGTAGFIVLSRDKNIMMACLLDGNCLFRFHWFFFSCRGWIRWFFLSLLPLSLTFFLLRLMIGFGLCFFLVFKR